MPQPIKTMAICSPLRFVNRHIQAKVIMQLALMGLCVFVAIDVYDYQTQLQRIHSEIYQTGTNILNRLTQSLTLPLWDLDDTTIHRILDSEMANPNVCSIVLSNNEGTIYEGKQEKKADHTYWPSNGTQPEVHHFRGNVTLNGHSMATVDIAVTPWFKKKQLHITMVANSIRWFIVGVVLVLMLLWFLKRNLILPVLRLSEMVQRVTHQRNYSLRMPPAPPDEIGLLYANINEMLDEIQDRDSQLKVYNEKLEQLVFERTKELENANRKLVIARDKAEEANQTKSCFLANMSHEIRTPLNAIIGMTDLALESSPPSRVLNFLRIIHSSSRSLLRLINQVLDFSKVEAGKLELETIPFNLKLVLEEVADMYLGQCATKGLELILEIDSDVPDALMGDPYRLRQILVNLVSNALKFTEQGEIHITVTCQEKSDHKVWLNFSVRDTGPGIPEEVQTSLFSSFTQADNSTTRQYGGTGLGLAICKRLTEKMGGRIHLYSQEGHGSTFAFTVPLARDASCQECSFVLPPDLHDLHALVVEDNPTQMRVIEKILQGFGIRTDSAASAKQALERLDATCREKPYDLICLDCRMPGKNGLELAKELHESEAYHEIPVIMLTAFGRENEAMIAKQYGVADFLLKPVKQSQLFNSIMGVFGHHDEQASPVGRIVLGQEAASLRRFKGARILVVEDNVLNQHVIRESLALFEFQVTIAANGLEALDLLEKSTFDLVFMDIQMPEMDGFETTARIRQMAGLETLPIIAMTAHAVSGYRTRCLQRGMDDYITKPIEQRQLHRILLRWLSKNTLGESHHPEDKQTTHPVQSLTSDGLLIFLKDLESGIQTQDPVVIEKILERMEGLSIPQFVQDEVPAMTQALEEFDFDRLRLLAEQIKSEAQPVSEETTDQKSSGI